MSQHRSGSFRHKQDVCLNRRKLLKMGTGLGAAALFARPSLVRALNHDHRAVEFHNLHTGEKLSATYWEHGQYLNDALGEINHVLRDHRSNEIHPIDPKLLDLLHTLKDKIGIHAPYQVISGYRSPATNLKLRKASNAVAKKSYHMKGQAIDINVPGFQLAELHRAALGMRHGGVGYYPKSNFIHVDTGRVRSW